MASAETIPLPAESSPGILKSIITFFSPRAEVKTTHLVELSREKTEKLIGVLKENKEGEELDEESLNLLRQDILRRFEEMNGKVVSGDLNWAQVQELFETVFRPNADEKARQILSEGLDYSGELLTKVMSCIGAGQQSDVKKKKAAAIA